MATHLSVRLAWHDRGWDAHVCDNPANNAHCIIHQHIRDSRKDTLEMEHSGTHFNELEGWLPPCSRDPAVYAETGYTTVHRDPLDFRSLPAASENIPPFFCCPSPYRWMREENFRDVCESEGLKIRGPEKPKEVGWVFEPDRQRDLLKIFWDKIISGDSLVFYYCNQGNPVDEKVPRILIGIGRINKIGPQIYFGTRKDYTDQYPVWSRCISQDYPSQGVRIPYQEYIKKGISTDSISCPVPRNALLSFSYVGEHVSDDVAVAVLERAIQSIENVRDDKFVPGDWDKRLEWLDTVLCEVWSERGAFPGIGSVLKYLGFQRAFAYQRAILAPLSKSGKNPWQYVKQILTGQKPPDKGTYEKGLLNAVESWRKCSTHHALLETLSRFEMSLGQIERIVDPRLRKASGICADDAEIVKNPYIISESDHGTYDSERIAIETIDHGMKPVGDAALFSDEEIAQNDKRRVRAVSTEVLGQAAENGDTVLPIDELLDRISTRFAERRRCRVEAESLSADRDFHSERLWMDFENDPPIVALKELRDHEQFVASLVKRRAKKVNESDSDIDWHKALISEFGAPGNEREKAALLEKNNALKLLFERRLSVLTGGAGTGKTSLLKVFLDVLEKVEGRQSLLLLAPTGKARVRLFSKTGRNSMTIHQFLLGRDWVDPYTWCLKTESTKPAFPAHTVIIDESSMIAQDTISVLLRSLDNGPLKRLILVGDPNQLPPIGPGRPFADIISWLSDNEKLCVGNLNVCMRTEKKIDSIDDTSTALTLAEGYRSNAAPPAADDEILAKIAKGESQGDLDVHYWNDHEELQKIISTCLESYLHIRKKDYKSFNESLGFNLKKWEKSEAWQILSPTRSQHFGTVDINRSIQMEFRGGLIGKAHSRGNLRPFGEQEMVVTDKVMQIKNRKADAWPQGSGIDYVANGEIGLISRTEKGNKSEYLDVFFSTQPSASYRFFRNQVDENLELAYALTVHKAQGSDFEIVFLIIPKEATTLSRELIYTGLTRFRNKLVLLVEKDISPLLRLRKPDASDTQLRNTNLFYLLLRPENVIIPYMRALIHRTKKGIAVRSKSEVIVADILDSLGISYQYEEPLISRKDKRDFRLPDFTVSFEGDIFYWEHLGMLSVPSYKEAWQRKKEWYIQNGYEKNLITSKDNPEGGIDAQEIEKIARTRILGE